MLALLPAPDPCAAGDALVEVLDSGCIDWSSATIRSRGIAAPSDIPDTQSETPSEILHAARHMAQANLLKTVEAVRINAASRVADRMAQHPDFREGLVALVKNAAITRQEYLSDGTLEIEMTMSLTGGFGQFVLPEEIHQVEPVTTVNGLQAQKDDQASSVEGVDDASYTGLIIDAAGIGAMPSLVPVVVDESGDVVYGPAIASREFAVARGMSGFATTLRAARGDRRVGARPMVVKAIQTRSTGPTDLVISTADAARLRSSVVHLNFMKACRVSIVMNHTDNP